MPPTLETVTTRTQERWECPPPPPALLTQDSMPRERRHLAGGTREGGSVLPFSVLSRECSLDSHGLLRFRTNDVLLGTSGVGCAYLWCLIPSVMCYGYRFAEWTLLQPFDLRLPTSAGRLPMVEWLPGRIGDYDPYNFFHTWRAQFCSDAPPNSNSRPHA